MNTVSINNLSIKFNEKIVLSNFNATISAGSFTAIMGESGCGKTSLSNAILGLIPYTGTIDFDIAPVFSVVFQENRLCEGISVLKNLKISAKKEYTPSKINSILADFGFKDDIAGKKICQLSGGMKRRISIIRALLAEHNLLILDEPFTGLDADTRQQVMSCVKKMTSGRTVILITHDISEACYFDSKIISIQ